MAFAKTLITLMRVFLWLLFLKIKRTTFNKVDLIISHE